MKGFNRLIVLFLVLLFSVSQFGLTTSYALSNKPAVFIEEWEMMWDYDENSGLQEARSNHSDNRWFKLSTGDKLPEEPVDVTAAWLRFKIPPFELARPALSISNLNGNKLTIYIKEQIVFESHRMYTNNTNQIIVPLQYEESSQMVYIKINRKIKPLGLQGAIMLGEYQQIEKENMKNGIGDIILGVALSFIGAAMLVSLLFIRKTQFTAVNSLAYIILSIGIMILTSTPYLDHLYPEFGIITYHLFDISSTFLMPAVFIFLEKVFGKGPYRLITRFRKIQVGFAVINILFFIAGFQFTNIREWYSFYGTVVFTLLLLTSNFLLIILLIMYCKQKNKEAIILGAGFGLFTFIGIMELSWFYYMKMNYNMFIWKWGVLCFLCSLVIILIRRSLHNYEQIITYSKQVEIFNNELQRAEKMDIISQLAASVAHEVRNPLQVTRGFLQIIGGKAVAEKDKAFMLMAIEELDRASEIITDFLTFAKPQIENTTILNIGEELQQIEGILIPLATMQGGVITVDLAEGLCVRGNSSKFKQALINIIKNSIEALGQNGAIHIQAYKNQKNNSVVIRIRDNGEGMNELDLKRLGEPYYSQKSKGTGLGLMVTFRIIEVMGGILKFSSKKGFGTEATIIFPYEEKTP
ncbi:sensor histidine kinase [Paenibacillus sinopodophylli]|uniref:sensor histidine kinase n=1 Tax=Paenibacillus sinopodophylli TaxID=1837342 RepID=UPI00110D0FD6|nr:HAMP domain-containing sensor histidine kinase [Paenibacillus sinopodophylli]